MALLSKENQKELERIGTLLMTEEPTHQLCDLYDAKVGDTMVLSEPVDMIYTELLSNLKMGVVTPKPNGQHIVSIVSKLSASDLGKLLVGGNFCDQDRFVIAIPKEVNSNTLKVVLYKLMKEKCVSYKISVSMGYLTAIRKGPTLKSNRRYAALSLRRLTEGSNMNGVDVIPASHYENAGAFMQAMRREAAKAGVVVSLKLNGGKIYASLGKKEDEDDSEFIGTYANKFNQWLDSIDFGIPVEIPMFLTMNAEKSYIKILLHNSHHDVAYRKGTVTKRRACLRKAGNSVFLRINGKVAHEFVGATSKNDLTQQQIKIVDLLLRPHGMTYEEIK